MMQSAAGNDEPNRTVSFASSSLLHAGSSLDQLSSLSCFAPGLHHNACAGRLGDGQRMLGLPSGGVRNNENAEESAAIPVSQLMDINTGGHSSFPTPSACSSQMSSLAAVLFRPAGPAISAPFCATAEAYDSSAVVGGAQSAPLSDGSARRDADGMLPENSDVSTEWHVHLVRQPETLAQKRRDPLGGKCQLCVQCPNGRKHSSLFAVHLFPHWLPANQARMGMERQDIAVSSCNIKAASTQGVHEWVEADQLQRARLTATMSDWLTGEEYPNAIIFSAHPNGHLVDGKQMTILTMPTSGCMKALMKIRRPLDPKAPTEQLQLHRLSTMKITLQVEFTRNGVTWTKELVSPGVVKLVSRVNDRMTSVDEAHLADSRKRKEAPTNDADINAASILLGRQVTAGEASTLCSSEPHLGMASSARNLHHEAQSHADLFYRAYAHNPEVTIEALTSILNEAPWSGGGLPHSTAGGSEKLPSGVTSSLGISLLKHDGSPAVRTSAHRGSGQPTHRSSGPRLMIDWEPATPWDERVQASNGKDKVALKSGRSSLSELRANGYPLSDVRAAGFTLTAARHVGYTLEDAKAAGYTLKDIKQAGFSIQEAVSAGFSLRDAQSAGYTIEEVEDLKSSGILSPRFPLKTRSNDSGEISDSQLFDLVADA